MTRLSRPLSSYGPKFLELFVKGSQARADDPIRVKDTFGKLKRLQNELYAFRRALKAEGDPRYESIAPVTMSFAGQHKAKKDAVVELLLFRASTEFDGIIDVALENAMLDPSLLTSPTPVAAILPSDPLDLYEPEERKE